VTTITITKATVIERRGTDLVSLTAHSLPLPIWPHTGPLSLSFEASKGAGADYCRNVLGLVPEVIKGDV
jgi:hypothetical protein